MDVTEQQQPLLTGSEQAGSQNPNATIGRIVHYVAYGTPGGEFPAGAHRAAIVTEVAEGIDTAYRVGLCIINPTGLFFSRGIKYDPACSPGTWHWPERA